jgi:nicotinate-nucleotide adenylyltransferase
MVIGVFGSACNPVTLGHYDAITQAMEKCDKLFIVPSFKHAFGKVMADYNLRCEMVSSFISDLSLDKSHDVSLSKIEEKLGQTKTPVYTFDVLSELQKLYPNDKIVFFCGTDVVNNFHNYYKGQDVLDNWDIVELEERTQTRSTLVREYIQKDLEISALVSPSVKEIIIKNKLYG